MAQTRSFRTSAYPCVPRPLLRPTLPHAPTHHPPTRHSHQAVREVAPPFLRCRSVSACAASDTARRRSHGRCAWPTRSPLATDLPSRLAAAVPTYKSPCCRFSVSLPRGLDGAVRSQPSCHAPKYCSACVEFLVAILTFVKPSTHQRLFPDPRRAWAQWLGRRLHFIATPPPTLSRAAPAVASTPPHSTPPPPAQSVSSKSATMPSRADESGVATKKARANTLQQH